MNAGIEWIKHHAGLSAIIAGIVFVAAFFLAKSKSSSSSSASTPSGVEGLSQNDLSFMQIQAGLQAQSMNDGTAVEINQQNDSVENNAIDTSAQVSENQTAAELQATNEGYATEENIASGEESVQNNEIQAGLEQDQYESNLSESALSDINDINGSQNRLSLIQSALGQQNAAEETEASYAGVQQASSSMWSNIAGAAGLGLFGL